jgi:phytoene/squalene synthetase
MATENDPYGYNKMDVEGLRKAIANLVRSNEAVIDNKKDMVAAANDTIKETKKRISLAVAALTQAERTGTANALENQATRLLKSVESV